MIRGPASAEELLEEMLSSPIDWPWKTTRLARDSAQDLRQRASSGAIAPGELYHENSKLYPSRCDELAASRIDPQAVRLAFLERREAGTRIPRAPLSPALDELVPLLVAVSRAGNQSLAYALELRIADTTALARHEPMSNVLTPLSSPNSVQWEAVCSGLSLLGPRTPDVRALLFVVGCFARNEVLYGVRAYRRTLIEAGHLSSIICTEAYRLRIPIREVLEFHDRAIDEFALTDGVEEAVLIVLEIGSTND